MIAKSGEQCLTDRFAVCGKSKTGRTRLGVIPSRLKDRGEDPILGVFECAILVVNKVTKTRIGRLSEHQFIDPRGHTGLAIAIGMYLGDRCFVIAAGECVVMIADAVPAVLAQRHADTINVFIGRKKVTSQSKPKALDRVPRIVLCQGIDGVTNRIGRDDQAIICSGVGGIKITLQFNIDRCFDKIVSSGVGRIALDLADLYSMLSVRLMYEFGHNNSFSLVAEAHYHTTMPAPVATNDRFTIHSQRVITPSGQIAGTVLVEAGLIKTIYPDTASTAQVPKNIKRIELGSAALLPGLIDAHVHLNDPRPVNDAWEGFDTGTRAAASAGITTVLDMPLNSLPVTTNLKALQAKSDVASGRLWVDVGLYAGLVPGAIDKLSEMLDAGVFGVKAFLCDSGLAEFPAADRQTLNIAMRLIAQHPAKVPLLAHAERVISAKNPPKMLSDRRRHKAWLDSRPTTYERTAVRELLELVADTGCPLHIVHVADGGVLEMIRAAKTEGLPVTAETCPHYLAFCSDEVPDGDTRFKCAPPIREDPHRQSLWQALLDGTLDLVASDHSPCPATMKHVETGDFFTAWGGIASLQLGPAVTWTVGQRYGISLRDLANWWCHAPAKRFGIAAGIVPGQPANLVAFNPDASWTVDPKALHHRHAVCPYAGMSMIGQAETVWLHGTPVVERGQVSKNPKGRIITHRDPHEPSRP